MDGWDKNAVGRGRANTDIMLDSNNSVGGCTSGAAFLAGNYSTFSTSAGDWFLPSLGEAMLIYTNLRQAGVGGFAGGGYWSSTELSNVGASAQVFSSGNQSFGAKGNSHRVRAVELFNYSTL